MNVIAAAQALNRKAAEQKWYHFCDPSLAFHETCYEDFLALWQRKSAGRPMPLRSEITPRDLKDFLRDIVMFQRVSLNPSRYTWRLVGTKVTEVAGHQTGRTFDESVPAEHLPRWVECGDLILDGGKPLRFLIQSDPPSTAKQFSSCSINVAERAVSVESQISHSSSITLFRGQNLIATTLKISWSFALVVIAKRILKES